MMWMPEAAFPELKLALQSTPTMGIPDPMNPFVQMVDEKKGWLTSVLLLHHGGKLISAAYYSAKLDADAVVLPTGLQAVVKKGDGRGDRVPLVY